MSELKKNLKVLPIANADATKILVAKHPLGAGHPWAFSLGISSPGSRSPSSIASLMRAASCWYLGSCAWRSISAVRSIGM